MVGVGGDLVPWNDFMCINGHGGCMDGFVSWGGGSSSRGVSILANVPGLPCHSPPPLLPLHTRIIVHAQTAA